MGKQLVIGAAILGGVIVSVVAVAVAAGPDIVAPIQVHVIEHATSDTLIDTGAAGDTSGDLLTFHNPVFGSHDVKQVGHDQGDCIRISPIQGSWECRWVTWLTGGSLTVEGPFFDTHGSVLAVTGGTGVYRNARGSMTLKSRNGGTEFDFIFNLIP
jgi:hypothetical protein